MKAEWKLFGIAVLAVIVVVVGKDLVEKYVIPRLSPTTAVSEG